EIPPTAGRLVHVGRDKGQDHSAMFEGVMPSNTVMYATPPDGLIPIPEVWPVMFKRGPVAAEFAAPSTALAAWTGLAVGHATVPFAIPICEPAVPWRVVWASWIGVP